MTLFTPPRRGDATTARPGRRGDGAGRAGLPRARRAAAGHRARRGAGAVAVGARHRAATRRPVRPAAGPDESAVPNAAVPWSSAIGWSYDLLFPDDQRGLWALSCFAGGAALDAVEHVLVGSRRPRRGGPRHHRPAGGPVPGQRGQSPTDGSVRYRLLDSIRAYAAARLGEAGQAEEAAAAHAAWYVETAAWCDAHVRGRRQPECVASPVPSGPTWMPRSPGAPATTRCPASGSPTGSAGPGWCSVTGRPAPHASADAHPCDPGTATARPAFSSPAGSRRRPGTSPWPHEDLDTALALADGLDDDLLRADVRAPPGLPRHPAGAAARRARVRGRRPGDVPTARAGLADRLQSVLAAYGALMLGDTVTATRHATEAGTRWSPSGTPGGWCMPRRCSAASRRPSTASRPRPMPWPRRPSSPGGSASPARRRSTSPRWPASSSGPGTTTWPRRRSTGPSPPRSPAETVGWPPRTRMNLARLHRTRGDDAAALGLLEENQRWYRTAGGGEGALLNRCLLARHGRGHGGTGDGAGRGGRGGQRRGAGLRTGRAGPCRRRAGRPSPRRWSCWRPPTPSPPA